MVHFTCDKCGKEMSLGDRDRYTVRVEIRPANDSTQLTEEDLDEDNLEQVAQILKRSEETGEDPGMDIRPAVLRFDLCAECRERFLKNPLNRQSSVHLDFSKN